MARQTENNIDAHFRMTDTRTHLLQILLETETDGASVAEAGTASGLTPGQMQQQIAYLKHFHVITVDAGILHLTPVGERLLDLSQKTGPERLAGFSVFEQFLMRELTNERPGYRVYSWRDFKSDEIIQEKLQRLFTCAFRKLFSERTVVENDPMKPSESWTSFNRVPRWKLAVPHTRIPALAPNAPLEDQIIALLADYICLFLSGSPLSGHSHSTTFDALRDQVIDAIYDRLRLDLDRLVAAHIVVVVPSDSTNPLVGPTYLIRACIQEMLPLTYIERR